MAGFQCLEKTAFVILSQPQLFALPTSRYSQTLPNHARFASASVGDSHDKLSNPMNTPTTITQLTRAAHFLINQNHNRIELIKRTKALLQSSVLCILIFVAAPLKAGATPLLTRAGAKRLDKPGLWLSIVKWEQPYLDRSGQYTFRVYCPTAMMRDVSNGVWQDAAKVTAFQNREYPTGLPILAYEQACQN